MAAYLEDFPLSVLFLPPRSLAPCLSCSIPSLSTSLVAHDLRPCFSADHEHLRALHDAGMDEHDLTSGSPAKAVSLVDEPLVDNQLHDFGAVREGFSETGLALLVFGAGSSLFPASPAFWLPRPS